MRATSPPRSRRIRNVCPGNPFPDCVAVESSAAPGQAVVMDAAVRLSVRMRAGRRCEYCHLPEDYAPFTPLHIEHVIAKQHGGTDARFQPGLGLPSLQPAQGPQPDRHRPADAEGREALPSAAAPVVLTFRVGWPAAGRGTTIGRATIAVLQMNDPDAVKDRDALILEGGFRKS